MIQVGATSDYSIETLREQLSGILEDFEVKTLPEIPEPSEAYDSDRDQYHSTRILVLLEKHVQATEASRLLGLAAFDLYVPGMNYVFGEARRPGRAAVISTRRLKPSSRKEMSLFGKRVLKEAVHETGHMLGLKHCQNASCVMHFSEHIHDTDRKNSTFCLECSVKLGGWKLE